MEDFSLSSVWADLRASGTLAGLALVGLIAIIVVLAAQLETLFSACRTLVAHRTQLLNTQRKIEQDIAAAVTAAETIGLALPDLRTSIAALEEEYARLSAEASEARQLRIHEVVMSDIFVQQGDRPYLARIYRPKPDPDEPLAAEWQTGRDHVLYGADENSTIRRFTQRYPTDRGFVIGAIRPFTIPWTPPSIRTDEPAQNR
ncbi:MAG TPA: hypothetical protein VGV37_12295 [Aliidongia sp.]|uniref:hypothetical protein n=1 Tax=Aliidongia sp. TaxID=1914230 RepID=UPI002DDD87B3|nr:hypothetical protein [Aliidongia sp.]HEV2675314.1 hypothetical protein [Aliidongia sp.]